MVCLAEQNLSQGEGILKSSASAVLYFKAAKPVVHFQLTFSYTPRWQSPI